MKPPSKVKAVTPSEIIEAGERLFGSNWRQPLADALDVNIATLRRWTSAQTAIPKRVAMAIQFLLQSTNSPSDRSAEL